MTPEVTGQAGQGLRVRAVVRRESLTLDVDLTAQPGEVLAVVGPNGSGKTTLLQVLAGLTAAEESLIECDGATWEDSARGVRVPAHTRAVGLVFQDLLLFPHLSVLDNVAFGPRNHGMGRRSARDRATTWLERLDLQDLAHRRPGELSGGQAQRVALARALAVHPRLLLLDEPLAALDVSVSGRLRADLADLLRRHDGVAVLVTHDPLDALTLADRIVVLDQGSVVQDGPANDVASRPRTSHVARLVGLNVLTGESRGTEVTLPGGARVQSVMPYDGPALVTFSPAAVALSAGPADAVPTGSARNRWRAKVTSLSGHGMAVRVHLELVGGTSGGLLADVTPGAVQDLSLVPGSEVWAMVKATDVEVHAMPGSANLLR